MNHEREVIIAFFLFMMDVDLSPSCSSPLARAALPLRLLGEEAECRLLCGLESQETASDWPKAVQLRL